MEIEKIVQQAIGGITRGRKILGVASLIQRRLLLTSAGIFRPDDDDLTINFRDQRPLKVRVVDYAYATGPGKNFAVLEIVEEGADERTPLSFGSFGADAGERLEIIVPNLDLLGQISIVRMDRRLVQAKLSRLDQGVMSFDYELDATSHTVLPGTPFLSMQNPAQGIVGILSKKLETGLDDFPLELYTTENIDVVPAHKILKASSYLHNVYSPPRAPEREVAEIERPETPPDGARTESLRYPIAEFHCLGGDDQNIVPPSDPLPDPPPPGGLEFRFRLDEQRTGIPYVGKPPIYHQPAEYAYPLKIDVDVYSEHLRFGADRHSSAQEQIEVNATGPSSEARFLVFFPNLWARKVSTAVFVFLRHEKFLLAAFRVHVPLNAEEVPQTLEHIYLSEKWFSIPGRDAIAPALTLYVRHEAQEVFLFAFSNAGGELRKMWAATSNAVEGYRKKTEDIYLKVEDLADEHEPNKRQPFQENAYALCHMGQELFSSLFFAGAGTAGAEVLSDLAGVIRSLPEGSDVVIATDATSQPFSLPWGLVYDAEKLPTRAFGGEKMNGFWGYRFRLSVEPSRRFAWPANVGGPEEIVTVGRVYENHELTPEMSKIFTELVAGRKISEPVDLEIEDYSIPALRDQSFDFLHFFCHGYTELADRELTNRILELAGRSQSPTRDKDLMYSPEAIYGSHIKAQKGIAKYSVLQEKVPRIAGSPIVQLSMCDSAQVSASGKSFVGFFLQRGARSVVGTEGPNPWSLAVKMDTAIIRRLFMGDSLGTAVWKVRQGLVKEDILALIYAVYGDADARLTSAPNDLKPPPTT